MREQNLFLCQWEAESAKNMDFSLWTVVMRESLSGIPVFLNLWTCKQGYNMYFCPITETGPL